MRLSLYKKVPSLFPLFLKETRGPLIIFPGGGLMFTENNSRQRGNYFPGILRRKKGGPGKTLAYVRLGNKGDYRSSGLTRMQAGCPKNSKTRLGLKICFE
jgi:hypothetical protein